MACERVCQLALVLASVAPLGPISQGCSSKQTPYGHRLDGGTCQSLGLRINEAASDNDGINVDEFGETDDWVELINDSDAPLELSAYQLSDGSDAHFRLPAATLAPGATVLVWADEEPQGPYHAPFKLSASGDVVLLSHDACGEVDRLTLPALPINQSFARLPDAQGAGVVCRYATPGRPNGERCDPPPPPSLPDNATFAEFRWPPAFALATGPLVISELALAPATYIELYNRGAEAIALAGLSLRIAASSPGAALPGVADGVPVPMPATELAAGARVVLDVSATNLSPEESEGVVSLFDAQGEPSTAWTSCAGPAAPCSHVCPMIRHILPSVRMAPRASPTPPAHNFRRAQWETGPVT